MFKSNIRKELLVLSILLLVLLIPIIYIGRYNVISADDFGYGCEVHHAWTDSGTIGSVIKAACETVANRYEIWQGTYSSIFIMTLNPLNFSSGAGWMIPVLLIGMIIFSNWYFLKQIIEWLAGEKKSEIRLITYVILLIYLITFIQTIKSPVEGFFWFNGSVHYLLMHSFMLLFLGLFISRKENVSLKYNLLHNVIRTIFLILGGIIIGGGNYITVLHCMEISVILLLISFIRKQMNVPQIIGLVSLAAGFVVSAIAPGNAIRKSKTNGMGAIEAIINSFIGAFQDIKEWINPLVVCAVFLLIPLFFAIYRQIKFKFKYPVWVCIFIFCLYASLYTPSLYGVGNADAGRICNVIQATFYLYLFLTEFYVLGAIYVRFKDSNIAKHNLLSVLDINSKNFMIYSLFFVFLFGAIICFTENRNTYTSVSAMRSLVNGEAKQYHEEAMERERIIKGSEMNIYLEPLSVHPHVLFYFDFVEKDHPENWINDKAAKYYDKESIQLISE